MAINTSDFSFQGIGIITSINVEGCTDSDALNYDPNATIEDGSCVDPVLGCMDPFADNFDDTANTDDGSCDYSSSQVLGCDDVTACNYNPLANTNDGSCILPDGCTDPTATNYDASAVCDDGSCTYLVVVNGCTDPAANNYDASANTDDGSCTYTVSGCTDPIATCNYDATATIDDGSCIYPAGCDDSNYVEYDASVTCPDNLNDCITISVLGCMDCGTYWEDLNNAFCDGVSAASILGSTNYNPLATADDGSCIPVVYGCTDANSCEFDDDATVSDGSCTTYPPSNADCDGNCLDGFVDVNGVCVTEVFGCTDDTYTEYNPSATVDDGSCSTLVVLGCTDSDALNYNPLANTDDGSCLTAVNGCMDALACNYDASANTDDGSCDYDCYGCTNDAVGNNPDANGVCRDWYDDPLTGTACGTLGCCGAGNGWLMTNYNSYSTNDASAIASQWTPSDGITAPHLRGCCEPGKCIGDEHGGGRIFWVDGLGGGLTAYSGQYLYPTGNPVWIWGNPDNNYGNTGCTGETPGADGFGLLTGDQNTTDMYTACQGYVAGYVSTSTTGGYSDWFIPSQHEMILLGRMLGKNTSQQNYRGSYGNGKNSNGDSLKDIMNYNDNFLLWTSTESIDFPATQAYATNTFGNPQDINKCSFNGIPCLLGNVSNVFKQQIRQF